MNSLQTMSQNMCLMDEKESRPGGAQSVQGGTHQMLSGVITY